jgi:hypothetical protein
MGNGRGEDVTNGRVGGAKEGMQQRGSVQSRQELTLTAAQPRPSLDARPPAPDQLQVSDGTAPAYRRHPHGLPGTDEQHPLQQYKQQTATGEATQGQAGPSNGWCEPTEGSHLER